MSHVANATVLSVVLNAVDDATRTVLSDFTTQSKSPSSGTKIVKFTGLVISTPGKYRFKVDVDYDGSKETATSWDVDVD